MTTPFRNDAEALRTRFSSLDEELRSLRAKAAEFEDVKERLHRVEKEHAEVREEIDARSSGRTAPLLDSLKIASPCNQAWESMIGDERTRFCPKCEKNVHNVSEMARAEAEAFLQSVAGPVCVRMYKRADGTVISADCPAGVQKKRVKRLFLATLGAGVAAVAFWRFEEATVMGEMVVAPPVATPMGTANWDTGPAPAETFATPPEGPDAPQKAAPQKTATPPAHKFATPPSKPIR